MGDAIPRVRDRREEQARRRRSGFFSRSVHQPILIALFPFFMAVPMAFGTRAASGPR
jgi:hypothetical protein